MPEIDWSTRASITFVVAILSLGSVLAQDMRENCVSCADTQRRCELDCMLPTYRVSQVNAWPANQPETFVQMSECLTGCTKEMESCTETSEQVKCLSCIQNCSYAYEADMLGCLQSITDVTSIATVDDSMDDCSNNVSAVMSTCAETCYSTDTYGGWTPATEEGISEPITLDNIAIPDYRKQINLNTINEKPDYSEASNVDVHLATSNSEEVMDWRSLGLPHVTKMGISGMLAGVVISVGLYTRARYVSQLENQATLLVRRNDQQLCQS